MPHDNRYVHVLCSVGECAKFLIDLAVEIVILYEHEYEIYGDITAATNCFKMDAYQQGTYVRIMQAAATLLFV